MSATDVLGIVTIHHRESPSPTCHREPSLDATPPRTVSLSHLGTSRTCVYCTLATIASTNQANQIIRRSQFKHLRNQIGCWSPSGTRVQSPERACINHSRLRENPRHSA
ncbi:hypothetical protein DOTSEDRAFT_82174, partial [Dothistroma septosporum NZE10]